MLFIQREKLKSVEVTPVKEPPSPSSEIVQQKCMGQSPAQHRSAPSPFMTCSGTPGTQALQDLMELAEEGMTLTQYGYTKHTVGGETNQMWLSCHESYTLVCGNFRPQTRLS